MKINFDTANLQMANNTVTSKSTAVQETAKTGNAYSVGKSLSDNRTYEGRKKSLTDIISGIKNTDVSVTQDYMTVMSHTVSGKDYKRLMENGVNPMDVHVEESSTILDEIKLSVARGGGNIEGFTDTIDAETLKEMTGLENINLDELAGEYDVTVDESIAGEIGETLNKASELTEMTEGMKLFLLSQDAEITIDSLYLAKHSAAESTQEQGSQYFGIETKGYLAKKGEINDPALISSKVEELLTKTGLPVSDDNINNGVWLVNNSVPVTGENLAKLAKINSINLPLSGEDLARVCFNAISKGEKPESSDITDTKSVYKEAIELAENMAEEANIEVLKRTRVFAETGLKMLAEANLMLLKSNYSIDTGDLEGYVKALREIEGTAHFTETVAVNTSVEMIESLKTSPADVLGLFVKRIDPPTIAELHEEGSLIKQKYEEAGKAYETLATEVRKDLGDSIKKAFSNVDDILKDLGFETSGENRRAVRILGYNSMPINKESIDKIKEADRKVSSVLSRITPMDTLRLIKSGKSPIKMSVDELNEYLDANEGTEQKEIERYSKFLYKLEKSKDISDSERRDFIEVYRFFHQLEKGDLAAIGSVLNAGNELTVSNLKTAMKTAKSKGMDVKIDDSFGALVSEIRNELEPEKLKVLPNADNLPLEDMYEELKKAQVDSELESEFVNEELETMREAMKASDDVVSELLMNRLPVTANNLAAMKGLIKQRGSAFSKVNEADSDLFNEMSEAVNEAMTDSESAEEVYDEYIAKAQDTIYEEALNRDSYIDVKALQHIFLELGVVRRLSGSETYEVPVDIDGEATSINLKIVHNQSEEPNVVVSFETDKLGRVSARLNKVNGEIKGYISCNLQQTLSKMESVADKLGKEVYTVMSNRSDGDNVITKIAMKDNDETISSRELYETAKSFLTAVKGIN